MLIASVTAAGLAVATGVVLDRVLLPDVRTAPAASTDGAAERPAADPLAADELAPRAADPTRAAAARPGFATAPPLKAVRGPVVKPSASASASPSTSARPGSGNGGGGGAPAPRPPSGGGGGGGGGGGNAAEVAVVSLTNKERAKAGCPALRTDARLMTSARRHSADMSAKNYFSHDSQNGDSPWKRMEDAGYRSPGAENIAKGQRTAASVMDAWMKSPGHRANILNCKLKAIGVGMVSSGGPYWTQNFGWS
ncbi:CAP domain-containing protein [Actinomadura flavalba]|uniref:CAP domain-containing protein n=1 Tax=Actinomadura flavalba TaxID=1120938 RepID=UPI0003771D86|nr:CAP domain-containing protein [Actinomadura flavalba]